MKESLRVANGLADDYDPPSPKDHNVLMRLRGTCSDVHGEVHEIDRCVDLDYYATLFLSGTWLMPRDEHLKTIADEINGLRKGVEEVAKRM